MRYLPIVCFLLINGVFCFLTQLGDKEKNENDQVFLVEKNAELHAEELGWKKAEIQIDTPDDSVVVITRKLPGDLFKKKLITWNRSQTPTIFSIFGCGEKPFGDIVFVTDMFDDGTELRKPLSSKTTSLNVYQVKENEMKVVMQDGDVNAIWSLKIVKFSEIIKSYPNIEKRRELEVYEFIDVSVPALSTCTGVLALGKEFCG